MKKLNDGKNIYEAITEKIIDSLEAGVIPWARPWDAVQYGEHRNGLTNRPYRGLNIMLLNLVAMVKGFVDSRWLTFRNAEKLGGHVKKGESGVMIIFWKFLPVKEREGSDFNDPVDDDRKVIPFARMYTVFNAEQCEGIELSPLEPPSAFEGQGNPDAEKIMALARVQHGGGRAYYSLPGDYIVMPVREVFENLHFYFSTGYHETLHWSGHPSRLNRTFGARFGDQDYAFEELVAEIGAAFLGAATGIPFEEMRHPEYINSWLKILKNDPKAIFTAASKAQTAADFILTRAGLFVADDEELPAAA